MVQSRPLELRGVGECCVKIRATRAGSADDLRKPSQDRTKSRLDSLWCLAAVADKFCDGFGELGMLIDQRVAGGDGILEGEQELIEAQKQLDQFRLGGWHGEIHQRFDSPAEHMDASDENRIAQS